VLKQTLELKMLQNVCNKKSKCKRRTMANFEVDQQL